MGGPSHALPHLETVRRVSEQCFLARVPSSSVSYSTSCSHPNPIARNHTISRSYTVCSSSNTPGTGKLRELHNRVLEAGQRVRHCLALRATFCSLPSAGRAQNQKSPKWPRFGSNAQPHLSKRKCISSCRLTREARSQVVQIMCRVVPALGVIRFVLALAT